MEVIQISESPSDDQVVKLTDGDREITVRNIVPESRSKEALEKEKEEIARTLYRIFSKYE